MPEILLVVEPAWLKSEYQPCNPFQLSVEANGSTDAVGVLLDRTPLEVVEMYFSIHAEKKMGFPLSMADDNESLNLLVRSAEKLLKVEVINEYSNVLTV